MVDFFQHTALEELTSTKKGYKRKKENGPQTWPHAPRKHKLKIRYRLTYMS